MTRRRWTAAAPSCGRRAGAVGARARVEPRADAGDHTLLEIGGGRPRVLLVGHVDTVWPHGQIAAMPIVRRDGRLHGPGVLDMKMGVAMGLLAARAVFETAPPSSGSVAMLITSDEETGSRTSRALIEAEALASDAVLVLEPALAGGALKTSRKGIGQYRVGVTGVAAHAGVDPAKGVSAIRELARQILDLERLHDLERGISVNAGVVAGGTRPNVVAAEAHAIVDVRAPSLADAATVDAAFRALKAAFARRAAGGVGRLRAAADGALGRGRGALRAGAGRGGRARPDHRRGRHRRRLRRQFHRRARACRPSTAWGRSATARTRRTSTSRSLASCRARRCWRYCCSA